MRILVIIFSLAILVTACNTNEKPKKPDNLLSKKEMEQIIYELYIINAAKGVNKKKLETNGLEPEAYVLDKHKIDSVQFAESNAYYAFDTDVYKRIVENVKNRLEREKKEFEELEKTEGMAAKKRRDSLDKIKLTKKDSLRNTKSLRLKKDTVN